MSYHLIQAARTALEALYQAREHVTVHTDGPWQKVEADCHAAIAALRAALEAPEAEPVAWACDVGGVIKSLHLSEDAARLMAVHHRTAAWSDVNVDVLPLYASPQPARDRGVSRPVEYGHGL